ncbi:MAG: type II toxin-antitoxin system VapC family toxin [Verrucomicrobiota bacterium]
MALDTNVLFDLADGKDFATTVLEVLAEERATVKVCPTVILEIEYEISHPASLQKGRRAEQAFKCFRTYGITPFTLAPVQHALAQRFSTSLQDAGVLPHGEFHDGCVLAEAALCPLEFLLTSDRHLLSINSEGLQSHFKRFHLPKVQIVSPRHLYVLLKRM